jgi:restriction system protein
MARRRQSSADDFIDLVAAMPWWLGLVLALVSYIVLHAFAAPPKVSPARVADAISGMWFSALASFGQYVVPILCLIGAVVSFLRRRKRESLLTNESADALNRMSWREFEMLIGEAFRVQGFSVVELGGASADGGVDIVLSRGKEKFLVQCKQWKAQKVPVTVVRELYGVMAAQGAAGGFVITSGTFTGDAEDFASGRNLKLIDGSKLFGFIQQGRSALDDRPPIAGQTTQPQMVPEYPSCPVCGVYMVRRTAKKGPNAGSMFWGCSRYPSCRETLSI